MGSHFGLADSSAVHLGVDILGVVRHVGRLLDGCRGPIPFEVVNDGDLLLLLSVCFIVGDLTLFVFPRLRVMLMRTWFFMVGFVERIS